MASILLLVAACGDSAANIDARREQAATTVGAGDLEVFTAEGAGFSIGLPLRWVPIDLTQEDADAIADGAEAIGSDAAEVVRGFADSETYPLLAVEGSGDPRVTVTVLPREPQDSIDAFEETGPATLEQLVGATVVSTERLQVSGEEALRIVYTASFAAGEAEAHQFYVLGAESVYVVTFTTFDPEEDRAIFAVMMETFRLVEG